MTLEQIAENARRAQELCTNNALAEIVADWQKRAAFERIMELLGEAAKRLPPELTARYPAADWRGIAGMRDRVSHGYDAVDYDLFWQAVQNPRSWPARHGGPDARRFASSSSKRRKAVIIPRIGDKEEIPEKKSV